MAGGGEIGIGYRIGAKGADETLQKLKQLHEEVRQGSITAKEYTHQHRELTLAGRASSQQFNDIKGAIMAANPNLLELNKTMSIFSGTANTAMSALNTINLSLLSGSQAAQSMSAQFQKNADDYNNFIRLFNSPQYGPGSPVTEAAYQKYQADLNSTMNLQNQLGVASINTGISVTLAAVAMLGSMSQTYTALKAIQWDRVFSAISASAAAALSAVTWFATAVALPIAIAVGVFYGAYELIKALNPAYAQSMNELTGIIQSNWNVSGLEAYLIAPFVGAALGFASLEDQMTEGFYDFVNSVINAINTIPAAINGLISSIPGLKSALGGLTIGTIPNVLPPGFANGGQNSNYNQMLQALNINASGSNSNGSGISAGQSYAQYLASHPTPSADQAGSLTQDQILASLQGIQNPNNNTSTNPAPPMTTQQALDALNNIITPTTQTATNSSQQIVALTGIGASILQQNQTLNSINAGIGTVSTGISTLSGPLLQAKQAQEIVAGALKSGNTSLQSQLVSLQAQYKDAVAALSATTAAHIDALTWDPNMTVSNFPDIMAASANEQSLYQQIQDTQNAIAQNANQQTALDNMTSGIGPVLQSLGLTSSTGIGSVIAGALGDAAGLGGAGINANQLAYFAQTGDYGVFTAAVNHDINPDGVTNGHGNAPTQQEQITALLNAWQGEGLGGMTAADAAKALGYTSGGSTGSSGSSNYDPTGGEFGGLPGQYGNPPAPSITVNVNNNVQGSILSSQDLTDQMTQSVMNGLLGVGWG